MASDKIVTPLFRASFLHLFEPNPKTLKEKNTAVYECTMIFEPDADLSGMKRIVDQAVQEKFGANVPKFFKSPFRRGEWKSNEYPMGYDLDKYPEYEGKIICSARSYKIQPGIVDHNRQDILDAKEVYSGIWARASIVAYWYDNEGGKGVAFGLQNFQKCMDGEPLGSVRGKAENDFGAFEQPTAQGVNNFDLLGI